MISKIKLVVAMGALAAFAVVPGGSASANAAQSACNVEHERWWTDSNGDYWVRLNNYCTEVKNVCVDIPYWFDAGPQTLLGNHTTDWDYGNKRWSRPGVGIYYC
ncbi:hypothetical protein ACNF49_30965 [Actinomadura sp. ATCC 39365]|uniref:hypothetical protein n=1 Tax=Nonomuraea sp. NPDC005692 TaxID=3157168 RepID=UPI0033D2AF19